MHGLQIFINVYRASDLEQENVRPERAHVFINMIKACISSKIHYTNCDHMISFLINCDYTWLNYLFIIINYYLPDELLVIDPICIIV